MAAQILLQNSIFTTFILPFLLIFFILFAVLQRTKILGSDQGQLNAFVSFIISLIFVAAFNYSTVINNLVLFLSIALVIIFVALMIWGFVSNEEKGFNFGEHKVIRIVFFIALFIAVVLAVLWAFGIQITGGSGSVTDFLFNQVWSQPFWTNLLFIILIAAALAIVLGIKSGKSS
ncbi:MAG: hypothetical protein M1165_00325 [Candidatus Pacearchaeota archaeon]|nr:hypothetical protein [Candidatus Pacearchaeota archaeon]MDE1848414.1 hypothetical protein [Nanoarchaeota archaeon]